MSVMNEALEEEKKEDDITVNDVPYTSNDEVKRPMPQSTNGGIASMEPTAPFQPYEQEPKIEPSASNIGIESNDHVSNGEQSNEKNSSSTSSSPLMLLLCATGITSCYLWYGTLQEKLHSRHHNNNDGNKEEEGSIVLFLLATNTFSSFLIARLWTSVRPLLTQATDDNKRTSSEKSADGNNKQMEKSSVRKDNSSIDGILNHPLLLLTSLTYLTAMAASNEALHYVSYPTCVLAKSSKLIPTMVVDKLVSWLVQFRNRRNGHNTGNNVKSNKSGKSKEESNRKSIDYHILMEWLGALFITVGILLFQYIQLKKQNKIATSGEGGGDSPFGLALLGISLFMDGLLGACQNMLKQKHKWTDDTGGDSGKRTPQDSSNSASNSIAKRHRAPTAMETMLYVNLYATLVLLPLSMYMGHFQQGMHLMFPSHSTNPISIGNHDNHINHTPSLLLKLNLSASLGQIFIFLTIHHFSPLICTTITTTRKFFTILLSVYKFGHVLDFWQWLGVGLVFGGLYLEICAKLFYGSGGGKGGKVEKKKKKVD